MATRSKSTRKRTNRSTKPKSMPAVRHLRYEITNSGTPGTETSHYIDLARDLSAINRRLYRQGMVYHVSKVTVVSRNTIPSPGGEAGFVSLSAAPNSWVTRSAWRHGKKMFDTMNDRAMQAAGGNLRGKYADFKVRALHGGATSPTYLLPKDNGGNDVSLGEWVYSKFQSPDGTTGSDQWSVHLLGPHAGSSGNFTSVGLVESFGQQRPTVQGGIPAIPAGSDDPMANLFDDGTTYDEILSDLADDNDQPPYDRLNYPGGGSNQNRPLVQQHGTLGQDGRVVLGGLQAICGLLEVEAASPIGADVYSILVEIAPGAVRGVKAEAI